MKIARWSIWLINQGQQPSLYFSDLPEGEAKRYAAIAAEKAFDGSDADGFLLLRSDYECDLVRFKKEDVEEVKELTDRRRNFLDGR